MKTGTRSINQIWQGFQDDQLPESSAKLSNICGLKYLKHFKESKCRCLKGLASAFEVQAATEYISDCNQLNF